MFNAGTNTVMDGVTVAHSATGNSAWYERKSGKNFNVFAKCTTTGTPAFDLYMDVSPLSSSIANASTDTSLYVSYKLNSSTIATKTDLYAYNPPSGVCDFPWAQCRIRAVAGAGSPDDLAVTAYLVTYN